MTIDNFFDLLTQLAGPLAVGVVAWFASWALEDIVFWRDRMTPKAKKLVILGISILVGSVSQWLILHPDAYAGVEAYLNTGLKILFAWIATQVAHKLDK